MTKFQLNYLRILGFIEGISLLFLLFIAMPVRAFTGDPTLVRGTGTLHGLLFLFYVYTLIDGGLANQWSKKILIIGVVMSSLPFGTFLFDRWYLRSGRSL